MKVVKSTFRFVSLWCVAQLAALGQEATGRPAWQIASEAGNLCSDVRSKVAAGLRLGMKAHVLDEGSLRALSVALGEASNDLAAAQIQKRLTEAADKIQALSAEATAILKDPGNQPLAGKLQPEKWKRELLVQAAKAKMLEGALARLRSAVGELHDWTAVMGRIVPPPELSGALKSRLGELLSDWEKLESAVGGSPGETSLPPSDASSPVHDVIRLIRARVAGPVVAAFIRAERRPYNLSPEWIAYLQRMGMPADLISAMGGHDTQLHAADKMRRWGTERTGEAL